MMNVKRFENFYPIVFAVPLISKNALSQGGIVIFEQFPIANFNIEIHVDMRIIQIWAVTH